ncbi:hypothetical protein NQ314_017499 [Rhamnusium bicolor]|uniref:Reverse transcriptase N-terminal domain-containing protein n=1 Tax=Rhamnusium bicolor TaxID=1586634 RepID=A0AAV8WSP5_9CUCU|nr:hypothetical protein NQ314_017499 [Rhamnusium bicolor]
MLQQKNQLVKRNMLKTVNQSPWWNTECERAIKESKQALNRYKKHKTSENLLIFKNMRARTRFIIKKSKKESWANYVSNINSSTPINSMWKKVNSISGTNSYHNLCSHPRWKNNYNQSKNNRSSRRNLPKSL